MHYCYCLKSTILSVVVVVSGLQLYDCVVPYVDIILHRGRF